MLPLKKLGIMLGVNKLASGVVKTEKSCWAAA